MKSICLRPPLYNNTEEKTLEDLGGEHFKEMLSHMSHCYMSLKNITHNNHASTHAHAHNHNHTQNSRDHNSDNTHENNKDNRNAGRYQNRQIGDNDHHNADADCLVDDTINRTLANTGQFSEAHFEAIAIKFHVHRALSHIRHYIRHAHTNDGDQANRDDSSNSHRTGDGNIDDTPSRRPVEVPQTTLKKYLYVLTCTYIYSYSYT